MNNTDLCYLSGVQLLALFREGSLSPVDLVQAQMERAERLNPQLNAFTDVYFEDALVQAARAQAAYTRSGTPRPLEGLTLAIKDSHDVAGWRTTHASLAYRDNVAKQTHPICQRLIDAGAIPIAKTSTPEFCLAGVTYSKLFGVTPTPWDARYTAGGSSGGSAAALAAGMTTLATGSDIAGSIRVPAACCGVVGYKPPYGRVPALPPGNLDPYCTSGPLARSVADCALMMQCMAGQHQQDIATLRDELKLPDGYRDINDARVAITRDLGMTSVSNDVVDGLNRVVRALQSQGAHVDWIDVDLGNQCNSAGSNYLNHRYSHILTEELRSHGDLLCDYTTYYAKQAGATDIEKFTHSFDFSTQMYAQLSPTLNDYDVLICPTVATHTVSATAKPWETININGVDVDTDFGWVLTLPFNMLNQLPVLTVPCGLTANALPTSVQIVARSFDDYRPFRIGHALEQTMPLFDCEERRPTLFQGGQPR